ncbi:hypothetical protein BKH46_00935 [Helicobacter sp. 12S02634-8]|nr:hypothetical protein BKH46_00935 [Helicobacter sp. 12S02634-8]
MSKKTQKDIKIFYTLIQKNSEEIQGIYKIFDDFKHWERHPYAPTLSLLIKRLGLEPQKPVMMALCDRIAHLKEAPMIQILKKHHKSSIDISIAKRLLLNFVSSFYAKKHHELILEVYKQGLFDAFYRELLMGVHTIGLAMNNFFESWQDVLIDGINKDMQKSYGNMQALKLLAPTIDTEEIQGHMIASDRSYSIPKRLGDTFIAIPYANAFDIEIVAIVRAIEKLLSKLGALPDTIYDKKEAYLKYFQALKCAFAQKDKNKLIASWREVDMCWMAIDTPFQVGHPLEYYEDRYRHAVAPEWDLRISNPDKIADKRVPESIEVMFAQYASKLAAPRALKDCVQKALRNVKVYNGLPGLFYGADMNGLFSAQVVPNDEVVTQRFGKKIFAFGDKIIQSARNKPKMKLSYETFETSYLQARRDILFGNEPLWHLVYDITTNGHEFGHILWIEEDTQRLMNIDGEFKNIEEFKATAGGLVAFFENPYTQEEFEAVIDDTLCRAVGLMAWREQEEVLPYYCEGMIHLYGAFESGVLVFDPSSTPVLKVKKDRYGDLKLWYMRIYESLAQHYIQKAPADMWLQNFVSKKAKGYSSTSKLAYVFIEWYWQKYQEMGQEVLEVSK